MPREDNLSSRFDYLFEPLGDEEPANASDDADSPARDYSDDRASRSAAPVRMAFAAFVLATLGAVAVVAVLLLQQPYEPTPNTFDVPLDPAPVSATVPDPTGEPVPPPVATASEIATETPQTVESEPAQQPAPQQERPPTPAQHEPDVGVTNSPATRAPISVAPEPRPPFPNQGPQRGGGGPDDGGGGLLGGGLPGPL